MAKVLKLIVALVVVVVALFFLSSVDSQKPVKRIETPVKTDASAQ
jgi:hypothetical protein